MGIYQAARGGLVEIQLLGFAGGLGALDEGFELGRRRRRGLLLKRNEARRPLRLSGRSLGLGLLSEF